MAETAVGRDGQNVPLDGFSPHNIWSGFISKAGQSEEAQQHIMMKPKEPRFHQ